MDIKLINDCEKLADRVEDIWRTSLIHVIIEYKKNKTPQNEKALREMKKMTEDYIIKAKTIAEKQRKDEDDIGF